MEIKNKEKLKRILNLEKARYIDSKGRYQKFLKIFKSHPDYNAWLYTKQLRWTAYYYSNRRDNPINALLYLLACRKLNRLGRRCGIECGESVFDEGIRFFHTQGTVINGNARVGKNCALYGNNCIGNDGIHPECPKLGDNIRVCVGAKIIGDVEIADNTVIAAGAIVVKSNFEKGAILAGIPAKVIGYVEDNGNFLD